MANVVFGKQRRSKVCRFPSLSLLPFNWPGRKWGHGDGKEFVKVRLRVSVLAAPRTQGTWFHHHKQPLSRHQHKLGVFDRIQRTPGGSTGASVESQSSGIQAKALFLISLPPWGDSAASCARPSSFHDPEKVHRCRRQEPLHVTSLSRGVERVAMKDASCPQKTWAFVSLKAKMQGKVGVSGITFLPKLFVASVFESRCSHIPPTMPEG